MEKSDIEQMIIGILKDLQVGSGDTAFEITPTTVPLMDLGFFDSLLGIETTVELEQRLGGEWDDQSVFFDKSTAQGLTVSEIAERIATKCGVTA